MNRFKPLSLRKSSSLTVKSEAPPPQNNPLKHSHNHHSHIQELIRQKYNFSPILTTNLQQNRPKKFSLSERSTSPISNIILVSHKPKLQQIQKIKADISLFQNEMLSKKQKSNSIEKEALRVSDSQKKKTQYYKNFIKRIQMNTTYCGFNLRKNQLHRTRQHQIKNLQSSNNSQFPKTSSDTEERKRQFKQMVEKGFKKKMEQSFLNFRKSKKNFRSQRTPGKDRKEALASRQKKEVTFRRGAFSGEERQEMEMIGQKGEVGIGPW